MDDTNKKGHIYLIRNLVNGKGWVGQTIRTVTKRWSEHKSDARRGTNFPLYRDVRKYSAENFAVAEVLQCDPLLLDELETHYIKVYDTFGPNGYNLTTGGISGYKMAKEGKEKLKAIWDVPGYREKTLAARKETWDKPGVKENQSAIMGAIWADSALREKASADGRFGAHVQWHVNRGIVKDDCPFCLESTQEMAA